MSLQSLRCYRVSVTLAVRVPDGDPVPYDYPRRVTVAATDPSDADRAVRDAYAAGGVWIVTACDVDPDPRPYDPETPDGWPSPLTPDAVNAADVTALAGHVGEGTIRYRLTDAERGALAWIGDRYAVARAIRLETDNDGIATLDPDVIAACLRVEGLDRVPCLSDATALQRIVWCMARPDDDTDPDGDQQVVDAAIGRVP